MLLCTHNRQIISRMEMKSATGSEILVLFIELKNK